MKLKSHPMLALAPIYLSVFVTALGIGLVTPLVPRLIQQTTQASEVLVGMTASVMFASFVLTAWPLGSGIDRWGIRPFLIGGLIFYGVAMAFMPWAANIWIFFLLRILEGIGWAGVWISTETYLSWVSTAERRGRNMAMYGIAQAVGTASGPLIGVEMAKVREGMPFFFTVVLTLVAVGMVATFVPEPQQDQDHHAHHEPISWALVPRLALPLVISALYGYGLASLVSLLPLVRDSEREVGLIISITVIASIIAQLPIGHLTDRYGARPVLIGCLSMLVPAAIAASLGPPFPILLGLAVMLGCLAGTLYPIGLTLLGARVSKRQLGMANGIFSLLYGVGSVIGPMSSGMAMQIWGKNALFGCIGALCAMLLAGLLLGFDRTPSTPSAPSTPQARLDT
jgi:MFS family permease